MFEMTNNRIILRGKLQNDFVFYEERDGKNFYKGTVAVKSIQRRYEDKIDILINEEQLVIKEENCKKVEVKGEVELDKGSCDILVEKLQYLKEEYEPDLNFIFLEVYIVKKPWRRGRSTILSVSLDKQYNSSYIKCICSGSMAEMVSGFQIGKKIRLSGKLVTIRRNKKNINEVLVYQIEK